LRPSSTWSNPASKASEPCSDRPCRARPLRRSASPQTSYWAQKRLAIGEESKKIAWKAQQRLHKRYKALSARGKNKNKIITAVGRELLGFIWAIGVSVEKQHQVTAAA
jgi:hypothetical protein